MKCHVNLVVSSLPFSDEKIKQMSNATMIDNSLIVISKLIKEGWPDHRSNVSVKAREYCHHRNYLSEYDGILLKGAQIIIPQSMRNEMLVILHESHFGIEKPCNLAKDVMLWPGMNAQM